MRPLHTHLGRRPLLIGLSLCAAVHRPIGALADSVATPTRFLAMSAKLCGVVLDDPDLAAQILAALPEISAPEMQKLAGLVEDVPASKLDAAISTAGLDQAANRVVAAWYSGMVGQPGHERVLSFVGAAAWTAMGYTSAPTECVGFGAWASRV